MGIDLASYRARVGTFNHSSFLCFRKPRGIFRISFLLYALCIILHCCHELAIFLGVFLSFFTSLLLLTIFVALTVTYLLNLIHSLFSVTVAGVVNKCWTCFTHFREASRITLASTTVIIILLMTFGTVETNPGPSPRDNKLHFSFWNVDSLLARDGVKKSFIEGLDSCHHFDIFGVCESFLTNKVSDKDLCINGFSPEPFRADCPDNTSHGGVCLYFKEHLPIKERKDLTALDETIVAEINLKRKKIFFVLSYRSPSKSTNPEVLDYISKLSTTLVNIRKEKHSLIVLAGDFNARSRLFGKKSWLRTAQVVSSASSCFSMALINLLVNLRTYLGMMSVRAST